MQSIRAEMRRLTGELPLLLTFKQVARELSVSITKVKQMVRAGVLQTVRLEPKGHPRVPAAEVTRLASKGSDLKRPRAGRQTRPKVKSTSGATTRESVRKALRSGRLTDR